MQNSGFSIYLTFWIILLQHSPPDIYIDKGDTQLIITHYKGGGCYLIKYKYYGEVLLFNIGSIESSLAITLTILTILIKCITKCYTFYY